MEKLSTWKTSLNMDFCSFLFHPKTKAAELESVKAQDGDGDIPLSINHLHLNTAIYCCSPLETMSILFLLSSVSDSQVIL